MSINISSVTHHLSAPTQFFGLKLWITIVICIGLLIVILLMIISLYATSCCHFRHRKKLERSRGLGSSRVMMNRKLLSRRGWDSQWGFGSLEEHHVVDSGHSNRGFGSGVDHVVEMQRPVASGGAGRCKCYSAMELHLATDGFSEGCMMSSGEHGEFYRGILLDGTRVAVKKFISNSDNVNEFIEKVEAIWCIRHKNLVKLLGYSFEGAKRMLVYDYIDNGDLHQRLHGHIPRISPLTWEIRMNIISGITKGLVYLHEDGEPIVIHQHLKSSSILLDHQWNPKISEIGITRFFDPQSVRHSLTRMSGYIAPEYIFTRSFNEKSDIYSFGVLIMEIITGRMPVEFIEFGKEEYLVDWLKSKVSDQMFDDIVDPSLLELPSSKELKRIILVALRCVDPDVENRPTIGDVIHMLQPRDLLLDDDSITDMSC